jgi:large subunit ribosomal protein L18
VYKNKIAIKKMSKERIRKRIRKKIRGTSERPRVYVFKSNRYVYTQVVDDESGHILASASTLEKEFKGKNKNYKNTEACEVLGEMLAKKLKQKKIERVIFDRGIYPYHGRIKAFAEAMRKGGLVF